MLPFPPASGEWLDTHPDIRALSPESRVLVRLWFWVMLGAFIHLYCGCAGPQRASRAGPPSPAQAESLDRLLGLAISFVRRDVLPGDAQDWESVLAKTSISLSGQEVLTAQPMSVDQVVAALPPQGVAVSIPLTEVVEEGVAAALLDPSLARPSPDEVDGRLPRARLHVRSGKLRRFLSVLVERGLAS